MRIVRRTALALAALLALGAAGPAPSAEAKCAEGNCWMICEDELNRCLAEDDGTLDWDQRCFERYQACGLECPM